MNGMESNILLLQNIDLLRWLLIQDRVIPITITEQIVQLLTLTEVKLRSFELVLCLGG